MRGLKKQRRVQVIALALICLAGATALIGFALRDGINLFRSPTQVVEQVPSPGEIFRLGGLVADGALALVKVFSFSLILPMELIPLPSNMLEMICHLICLKKAKEPLPQADLKMAFSRQLSFWPSTMNPTCPKR